MQKAHKSILAATIIAIGMTVAPFAFAATYSPTTPVCTVAGGFFDCDIVTATGNGANGLLFTSGHSSGACPSSDLPAGTVTDYATTSFSTYTNGTGTVDFPGVQFNTTFANSSVTPANTRCIYARIANTSDSTTSSYKYISTPNGVSSSSWYPDVPAPTVTASITTSSANVTTVTLTTNSATNCGITYGATSAYGNSVSSNTGTTSHTLTLGSLTQFSTIHWHWVCQNTGGSQQFTESGDLTYTVTPEEDAPAHDYTEGIDIVQDQYAGGTTDETCAAANPFETESDGSTSWSLSALGSAFVKSIKNSLWTFFWYDCMSFQPLDDVRQAFTEHAPTKQAIQFAGYLTYAINNAPAGEPVTISVPPPFTGSVTLVGPHDIYVLFGGDDGWGTYIRPLLAASTLLALGFYFFHELTKGDLV